MIRISRRLQAGLGLALAVFLFRGATEADPPAEGPARLVHDFFPGEFVADEPPSQLTKLGEVLYFVASDIDNGQRVWRSDGTPAGTRLVSFPGEPAFAEYSSIIGHVGSHVLWVTYEKDSQRGWLVSSGRQGDGVVLEAPGVSTKALGWQPPIVGDRYFFYRCSAESCAIWSTDGTLPGMGPVRTLARFTTRDQQLLGTFAGRWLVFRVAQSLYAYDVTRNRALQLLPTEARELHEIYPTGGSLFFKTGQGPFKLWVSRLDAPQAQEIFTARKIAVSGWSDGKLYFTTENGRLWSADGRSGKVRPYSNLRVEPYSILADQLGTLGPLTLVPMLGYYYGGLLAADESRHELREIQDVCSVKHCWGTSSISAVTLAADRAFLEIDHSLWQTDGTPQGTKAHDVLGRTDPRTFRVIGDRLVLGATSHRGEQQLWETDGTANGTRALSDGDPDRPFQVQGPPTPFAGALYVAAEQKPVGQQLWRVADGQTAQVTELRHVASGLEPYFAIPVNDRLGLGGKSGGWMSLAEDGSIESLPEEYDDCHYDELCPRQRTVLGGRFLFGSSSGLWATDGTAAGTRAVTLEGEDELPSVAALGPWGERALVLDSGQGLWTSDGSSARFVTRLPRQPYLNHPELPVGPPLALGPLAFLFRQVAVNDNVLALELWRTDATAAGTFRLASIPFDVYQTPYPYPVIVGGRLFFRFRGIPWVSDGSVEGTRRLPDLLPNDTLALTAGTDLLYALTENFETYRQTLWAIDPKTLRTSRLGEFHEIAGAFGFPLGSVLGNTLFFQVNDRRNVERWWVTEGTPETTHILSKPLASQARAQFFNVGDRRYFTACDSEHGCELWSTDRLGEDTRLVQDLWPGPQSSDPEILTVTEDAIWFAATEPGVGRELWKIDLSQENP